MSAELSIVVAVYNETPKNLSTLIERLAAAVQPLSMNYEVIFVNDGSTSLTTNHLRQLTQQFHYVRLINFSRNFGQQAAISAGIDYAKGQAIVNIDSDLQDPPELIPDMVHLWRTGFDVVYGQRSARRDKLLKRATAFIFYRVMSKLSSTVIPQDTGDFRLIDRRVAEVLMRMPERNRFLRGLIPWLGFSQTAILVERDARDNGESGYTLKKLISLAFDGIISFSSMPLFLIPTIGVIVIFAALVLAITTIFTIKTPFTLTLLSLTAFVLLSGVQLFSIGLVAIYLSRVLDEVRQRPTYVVADVLDHNNMKQSNLNFNAEPSESYQSSYSQALSLSEISK